MDLNSRIEAFVSLREKLLTVTIETEEALYASIRSNNAWFTIESVDEALKGIVAMLEPNALKTFCADYVIHNDSKKTIGLVLAGNLPAVGFHDVLMVLLAGYEANVKLSSEDKFLIPYLVHLLPAELRNNIHYIDRLDLKAIDGIIATGSTNTSRYFETYFSSKPNIIRKNRTSCAVLTGEESEEQLAALGKDVFTFYGKGCRNVTKLFVPEGYSFQFVLDVLSKHYTEIIHNSKYSNNYDYYKSIYLVNRAEHLDTGFLILIKNEGWGAPLSVLYYQEYKNEADLNALLDQSKEQIQCVVGSAFIPFGEAQCPAISEFADGIDTMCFLLDL